MSQNANNTFRIPSPDDDKLLEILEEISSVMGSPFSLSVGGIGVGQFMRANDARVFFGHDLKGLRSITTANISFERFFVGFHRSVTKFGSPLLVEPSIWEAEFFAFSSTHDGPDPTQKMLAISQIVDNYRREVTAKIKPSLAPKEFSDIYARQLAGLTDLHNKIIRDADEARLRVESEIEQRRQQQEAKAEEVREKLEIEASALRRKIALEEEALDIRKKEIDDRSHTHARRQMREAITVELKARQSRPAVSKNALWWRFAIITTCLILFSLLGGLAIVGGQEVFLIIEKGGDLGASFYAIVARSALLTVGAVGVGGYFLNFLRRIHDEDLRAERDLERYLYDVDRASWAIETVLEAQRRDGESEPVEIPPEWVQGVTRGLFQRSEHKDPEEAALAAIGSVFNFAAEAELGPGGTRIKFNKPGLRALKRHAESADGGGER